MRKIEDAFRNILGVVPRYMRPPYGEHSERVRKIMEEMGYIMILWDVDQPEIHVHESTSSQNSDFDMNSVSETGDHGHDNKDHGDGQDDASEKQLVNQSREGHSFHNHRTQSPFKSKWAEAVRGVPHLSLDRDTMMVGGIFQEATSVWAVEYVLYHGYDVMPVGACLGETDPRLWYKEIGAPADPSTLPQSCNL